MREFAIPYDVFSIVTGLSVILSLSGLVARIMPQISQIKNRLKSNVKSENDSGVHYLQDRQTRNLIEFNAMKFFAVFRVCPVLSIASWLVYSVGREIAPLYVVDWYFDLIAICTYLGILPAVAGFLLVNRLWVYYIKLLAHDHKQ